MGVSFLLRFFEGLPLNMMMERMITPSPTESRPPIREMYNSGAWSEEEKLLFLQGLEKYGFGQWKEIGRTLKTR